VLKIIRLVRRLGFDLIGKGLNQFVQLRAECILSAADIKFWRRSCVCSFVTLTCSAHHIFWFGSRLFWFGSRLRCGLLVAAVRQGKFISGVEPVSSHHWRSICYDCLGSSWWLKRITRTKDRIGHRFEYGRQMRPL